VQETDGSFFESYTALSWKQENRRLLVARELQERPGPGHPGDSRGGDAQPHPHLERGIGPPLQPGVWWPPDQRTHGKEHEDLYVEVLYTLANRVGALPGSLPHGAHQGAHQGTSQDDLHDYAMAAFGFNSEQHRRLLAVAREEKPPIVVLNVVVLEAEGLEAKDANGECVQQPTQRRRW
ncbi:uncharacterized protein LOC127752136, partial [Frankliniella occidentalis]|uniref:Uncharacterized protein LOC127752136 n=1 Tax=Frankliniella occidentalis TaxID=133901 RepID=A0A9C6XBR8_FRAOC